METTSSGPVRAPLAGRYRIDARLGAGGMGTVYKGTDLTTGRIVALKVLHENLVGTADFLKRFEREARVMAALSHLSDEFRQVVVLRELEGLSYGEIAGVLDVPQGTVESRLFRARAELRTLLKDYLP